MFQSPHTFHIPVMGTGFTIDTPLKVARFGISSVISLCDHELAEQMRQFHAERAGEPFEPIGRREPDVRARRLTAYLDLVHLLVVRQMEVLRAEPFTESSESTRYFRMLPETPLKQAWREMLATGDPRERGRLEADLRRQMVPGSIDVNIMTKVDRDTYRGREPLPSEFSDALSGLRGYASSSLESALILSAGFNQRLFSYMARFADFMPDQGGRLKKRICLKVSDFRSAQIQGKFLAKRGLWVSEYRIESGLNCGGHAFATPGHLMGPILEEFKNERGALRRQLHEIYSQALANGGHAPPADPLPVRVTFQGGVGTAEEHQTLLDYYELDAVGWATPFLLVPEVTNVDAEHLERLMAAGEREVELSYHSPLGVPFWSLQTSESERQRLRRIRQGQPGSPCPKGFLVSNTEFTRLPICTASKTYQRRKLTQLEGESHPPERLNVLRNAVLEKSCLCHDLSGAATVKHGLDEKAVTAVCCGPNIVNFSRLATLEEMIGHIYGWWSQLTSPDRPHVFMRELRLYVDYLRKEIERSSQGLAERKPAYFEEFLENLHAGVDYYRERAEQVVEEGKARVLAELEGLRQELEALPVALEAVPNTGA